jgi:hypothetical protein
MNVYLPFIKRLNRSCNIFIAVFSDGLYVCTFPLFPMSKLDYTVPAFTFLSYVANYIIIRVIEVIKGFGSLSDSLYNYINAIPNNLTIAPLHCWLFVYDAISFDNKSVPILQTCRKQAAYRVSTMCHLPISFLLRPK